MVPDYNLSTLGVVLSLLPIVTYVVLLGIAVFRAGKDRRWLIVVAVLPIIVVIHSFNPTDVPPDTWTWSNTLMAVLLVALVLFLIRPKKR